MKKKNAFISARASSTHALVIKFLLGTLICSVETMIGVCLALESSPVFFFFHSQRSCSVFCQRSDPDSCYHHEFGVV